MRRVLSRLAIAGIGLVVALALAEVLLRVFSHQLPPAVAANAGITTDSNIGVERFRRAWLGSLVTDDERGMRTASNLDVQLEGHPDFSFRLRTNEHGFRSRYSEGPVDAVAIGDSFTFGYGVDEDEAWPTLLEKKTGHSVANLGQTNYGPQAELQVLNSEGLSLQPKLVIWQFFANDFVDANSFEEWQQAGKPNIFQLEAQRLADDRENSAGAEPLQGLRGFLHRNLVSYELAKFALGLGSYSVTRSQQVPVWTGNSRLFLNRGQLDGWSNPEWPVIATGRELTEEALLAARQRSEAMGASFLIVLVPSKEEVYTSELGSAAKQDPWNRTRNSQLIMDLCDRHQMNCFDAFESLKDAIDVGAVPYFTSDGHLNEDGHHILSNALAEYLATNNEWR